MLFRSRSQGLPIWAAGQQGAGGAINGNRADLLALLLRELSKKLLNAQAPAAGLMEGAWVGAAELMDQPSGINQGQAAAAGPQIDATAEQSLSP